MRSTLRVLVLAVSLLLTGPGVAEAAPSGVSTVEDAAGDATHPTPDQDVAPYMDVRSAKVQQKHQALVFFMELDGAIPDTPPEPSLIWVFHVDTDEGSSPGGLYVDDAPRVLWDQAEEEFVGQVLHRSTNQEGKVEVTISDGIPFEIKGATVRLTVDPALLGNPESFEWNAATRLSTGVGYSDFAPNCLTCLVAWTAK